jgi:Cu-Zn family superoxide dismutase
MSRTLTTMGLAAVLAVTGCATGRSVPGNTAMAELRDARGQVVGMATLAEVTGGLRIVVDVKGLPPGPKGVHVHEVGTCEAPFTSAGGHFNPTGRQHGALNPQGPHAGDLPNLTVAGDGSGHMESMNTVLTLAAGPNSVLDADGSALVVHAGPDDFRTDPAGNSGARIACGVIVRRDQ